MAKLSVAVIGLGRFGSAVARTLAEQGHDVMGVDLVEAHVQRLSQFLSHVVQLDATDEAAVRAAGVGEMEIAVIGIGENLEASLMAVMIAKEVGIETVIAKATTPMHGRILERLGVTRVVYPEWEMGVRVAHGLVLPTLVDFFELSRDFALVELSAPDEFVDKTLEQLDLRRRYGVTLVAIKTAEDGADGASTRIAPLGDTEIHASDILVILGGREDLERLHREIEPG